MGWKQYVRQVEAERRRSAHATARWQRQMEKLQRERAKQAVLDAAARDVAQFEDYLASLVSLHKECTSDLDWDALARSSEPARPTRSDRGERAARADLEGYRATFLERLFGTAKKRAASLEEAVRFGRIGDDEVFAREMARHQTQFDEWQLMVRLATSVVERQPHGYRQAIDYLSSFDAIEAFQTRVQLVGVEPTLIVLRLDLSDPELVPDEELKLTASGKLSTKAIPATRRWTIYQDHVCSCAWRAAREMFAATPIDRLIVNIFEPQLDASTGHVRPVAILGTHFLRGNMKGIRFESIDPSEALKHVSHRMKFKKSAGFEAIEPVTTDENWVSAG